MTEKEQLNKLADIIEQYPNAIFSIDNDHWSMNEGDEYREPEGYEDDYEPIEYANSEQFNKLENCYGEGIARAMIVLLNRQGYNLSWEWV